MNLFILTNSDGTPIADKTVAAVTSVTNSAALDDLGNLVLGDSEPLTVKFTTGPAAPAFAGDSTYGMAVSIGGVTPDGSCDYVTTSAFTPISGGWTGRLALNTTSLIAAVQTLGGWLSPQYAVMPPNMAGPRGGWLTLQIQVRNPSGYVYTYALAQVFIEWRVVPDNAADTDSNEWLADCVHPRRDITSLTGGGATSLDGQATAFGALPVGYTGLLSYGRVGQTWQLIAGTDAEAPTAGVVRPDDFDLSSNALIWVQL